jgi:hypothetical protein
MGSEFDRFRRSEHPRFPATASGFKTVGQRKALAEWLTLHTYGVNRYRGVRYPSAFPPAPTRHCRHCRHCQPFLNLE